MTTLKPRARIVFVTLVLASVSYVLTLQTGTIYAQEPTPTPEPTPEDARRDWGNTGTDFNTNANWAASTGGVAPGVGDVAYFTTAAVTQPNLSASRSISGLYFFGTGSSGYDITRTNSAVFTLTGRDGTGFNGTSDSSAAAIRADNNSSTNTIDVPLILAGTTNPAQTFFQNGGGTLIVNGAVSSTTGVILSLRGGGTIQLNGANTYTAGTTIDTLNQTVVLGNDSALGMGGLTFNTSATITPGGGNRMIANAILLDGAVMTIGGGNDINFTSSLTLRGAATRTITLNNSGNTATFSGNIFLSNLANTGRTLAVNGTGALTISAVIANFNGAGDPGGLQLNSANATLTLSGTNTYSGTTTLTAGNLILGNKSAFGTSNVQWDGATTSASTNLSGVNAVANVGTLTATGNVFTGTNSLQLSGAITNMVTTNTVTNNMSGAASLTLSGGLALSNSNTSRTMTFSGTGNTLISGAITNGGTSTSSLVKSGAGTLTLAGTNSYAGTTTVNAGIMLVNGNNSAATGAVSVNNSGTTLGGTGTIGGAVTVASGAKLRGGTGAAASGTLTLANNLTLNSGSIIELVLGPSGTHSTLNRTGGIWSFASGQSFSFIDPQNGVYDNIITGLAAPPNTSPMTWIITNPGWIGTFTFDGGLGPGNIDLNLSVIPEPSTWVAGALALTAMAFAQRRRLARAFRRAA